MKYDQLVVCQGLDFKEENKKDFYDIFKRHGFSKPKILGVVETLPSKDCNGKIIPETGGRKDFFFFINDKDKNRFQLWKINYNMIFFEDIFYTQDPNIYPEDFRKQHKPRW